MQHTLTEVLRNTPHYLDTNSVAELLSMQPDTIHRYCRQNFMPHIKLGTSYRFDPKDLAAWVQAHQFSAGGNVADKITDWVIANVLDRTLDLPIPTQLAVVLTELERDWKANAVASINQSPISGYSGPLLNFQVHLNSQLTSTEQRALLAELLWLGVTCA